jgi:hypothetical protein
MNLGGERTALLELKEVVAQSDMDINRENEALAGKETVRRLKALYDQGVALSSVERTLQSQYDQMWVVIVGERVVDASPSFAKIQEKARELRQGSSAGPVLVDFVSASGPTYVG